MASREALQPQGLTRIHSFRGRVYDFVDVLKVRLVTDDTIVHRNYISCQLFALVEDRLYAINSIILYVC